MARHVTNIVAY